MEVNGDARQLRAAAMTIFCVRHLISRALSYGDYTKKVLTNRQYVFKREADGEKVLVAINADENEYTAYFDTECADALNLITGKKEDLSGKIVLPPYSFRFYRCM